MPRHPETLSLLEQALRYVISEQGKLLKCKDAAELVPVISALGELALATSNTIAEGVKLKSGTVALTTAARQVEHLADKLSEELWTPIKVDVGAIYGRVERSLKPRSDEYGFAREIRMHYHNLRLRLLEQTLGARMLSSNSDLGEEVERIWQQFLERHLGPMFRVLRGGYICDHQGNKSGQMDIIVVPADGIVFVPGDSEGGKAHVLIDQVISAILVTSNLTAAKLKSSIEAFELIPVFNEQDGDFPGLNGHPWPLCYVLGAQSDSAEQLKKAWVEACSSEVPKHLPQFVVSLDEGFLYSGLRRWPCPRWPGNYKTATDVAVETELFGGLGLAWLVTQQQGRLAVLRNQVLGPIDRYAQLLHRAMMREEGVPTTYSMRFNRWGQASQIAGVVYWGGRARWVHNGLEIVSLRVCLSDDTSLSDIQIAQEPQTINITLRRASQRRELKLPDAPTDLDFDADWEFLRWFHYFPASVVGRFVAVTEIINYKSKPEHSRRVAVFDSVTGMEMSGAIVDGMKSPFELESVVSELEKLLPREVIPVPETE